METQISIPMFILGIDPSYTNTGIAVYSTEEEKITYFTNISVTDKNVYDIYSTIRQADLLTDKIIEIINSLEITDLIIEYPILATRSGAYLGLIQQALYLKLKNRTNLYEYTMVPAQAINSITKAKSKSDIVSWTKENVILKEKGRYNHDVASAIVLCKLFTLIKSGKYKNSFKVVKLYGKK